MSDKVRTRFVQGSGLAHELDDALKTHFSVREDVPQMAKDALREKLYAAVQPKADTPRWVWVLSPCTAIAALLLLAVVYMLFGWMVTVMVAVVYYAVVAMGAVVMMAVLVKQAGVGINLHAV